MPRGKDERTLKMVENYVEHWRNGKTPREIAKIYKVSYSCVYKRLGEIAKKSGYTRKQLLQCPHSEHHMSGIRVTTGEVEKVNAEGFEKQLAIVGDEIKTLKGTVDQAIQNGKDFEIVFEE